MIPDRHLAAKPSCFGSSGRLAANRNDRETAFERHVAVTTQEFGEDVWRKISVRSGSMTQAGTYGLTRRIMMQLGLMGSLAGCSQGLAAGNAPGNLRRFGSVVRRFTHSKTLVNFAVSEAADRVVGLALLDRHIYVWRLSDGVLVERIQRGTILTRQPVAFIDGGRQFVTTPTDLALPSKSDPADPVQRSAFSVFDSASGSLIRNVPSWKLDRWMPNTPYANTSGLADQLEASGDGMLLVGLFPSPRYPFLTTFDVPSLAQRATIYIDRTTQTSDNRISVSRDGRQVAVSGLQHRFEGPPPNARELEGDIGKPTSWIYVVEVQSGSVQSKAGPFLPVPKSVALSPNGRQVVTTNQYYLSQAPGFLPGTSGPNDPTVLRVSSLGDDRTTKAIPLGATKSVPNADWSMDGTLIVAGGTNDGHVVLLDAGNLAVLDTCRAEECSRVRFVANQNRVAYIDGNEVVLRDVV